MAVLRGCYVSIAELKRALAYTDTRDDDRLFELAEYASRQIDSETGRVFYTFTGVRYFDAKRSDELLVPDLLRVTELATDDDGSRAYATVWGLSDYDLEPANEWPKWELKTTPYGSYSFPRYARGVRVTGLWGYGDGDGSAPWRALATTATVATADGTAVTTSANTGLSVGQTWLVESEQMYVTDGANLSWTVERGVNGTTAAAHAGKAISVALYPKEIVEAGRLLVEMEVNAPASGAAGDSGGTVSTGGLQWRRYRDKIEPYRLVGIG